MKKAAAPAAPKKAARKPAVKKVEAPAPWAPAVGELCQHEGNIIAITCFEPLEANVYKRLNNVVTTQSYPLASLDGVEQLSKQEVYERLY